MLLLLTKKKREELWAGRALALGSGQANRPYFIYSCGPLICSNVLQFMYFGVNFYLLLFLVVVYGFLGDGFQFWGGFLSSFTTVLAGITTDTIFVGLCGNWSSEKTKTCFCPGNRSKGISLPQDLPPKGVM